MCPNRFHATDLPLRSALACEQQGGAAAGHREPCRYCDCPYPYSGHRWISGKLGAIVRILIPVIRTLRAIATDALRPPRGFAAPAVLRNAVPQLLPSIPVDVMPGETDPANYLMPQQPLNRCLLPVAARCRPAAAAACTETLEP